jgi:hypothetical protein
VIPLTEASTSASFPIETDFTIGVVPGLESEMPFDPSDFKVFSADFMEFALVFVTIMVSLVIMVVLGNWWAR